MCACYFQTTVTWSKHHTTHEFLFLSVHGRAHISLRTPSHAHTHCCHSSLLLSHHISRQSRMLGNRSSAEGWCGGMSLKPYVPLQGVLLLHSRHVFAARSHGRCLLRDGAWGPERCFDFFSCCLLSGDTKGLTENTATPPLRRPAILAQLLLRGILQRQFFVHFIWSFKYT